MSSTAKPPSKSTRRRPVSSLESAVLGALSEFGGIAVPRAKDVPAQSDSPHKVRYYKSSRTRKAAFEKVLAQLKAGKGKDEAPVDVARAVHNLRARLREQELLTTETVRVRSNGIDRQLVLEYSPDPEDPSAVLMRVSLAANKPLESREEMLTSQQAADLLNVSRPYVTRLVDAGKFKGVVLTAAGHRRIPRTEVERVAAQMRSSRRAVMDDLLNFGEGLENVESKPASKRRWVKA